MEINIWFCLGLLLVLQYIVVFLSLKAGTVKDKWVFYTYLIPSSLYIIIFIIMPIHYVWTRINVKDIIQNFKNLK